MTPRKKPLPNASHPGTVGARLLDLLAQRGPLCMANAEQLLVCKGATLYVAVRKLASAGSIHTQLMRSPLTALKQRWVWLPQQSAPVLAALPTVAQGLDLSRRVQQAVRADAQGAVLLTALATRMGLSYNTVHVAAGHAARHGALHLVRQPHRLGQRREFVWICLPGHHPPPPPPLIRQRSAAQATSQEAQPKPRPANATQPTPQAAQRTTALMNWLRKQTHGVGLVSDAAAALGLTHDAALDAAELAHAQSLAQSLSWTLPGQSVARRWVCLPNHHPQHLPDPRNQLPGVPTCDQIRADAAAAGRKRLRTVAALAAEVATLPDDPLYPMGPRP